MSYDAFISYSHGADLELAKHMRDGLQKLSKPWNRRRALSIFLDQSSLELSSQLGDSLGDRIEDTEWLVLLMSEQAAQSKWVGEEIKRWAEAKSKERIALVLTDGTVVWDPVAKDFDYARSSSVNEHMRGVYTGQDSEPLYLDLTWTGEPGVEETLGLDNPRFRDGIATISAAIQGKSKDEVEGEDIRQHRRLVRLRRAAVTGLCVLTVAAIIAGIIALIARSEAIEQRQEAETQAKRSESRAIASDALNNVETEPDLAVLLALESGRVADTADARGSLAQVLSQPTRFLERTDEHDAFATAIAFSESGRRAATADDDGVIRLWDVNADPNPSPQATVRSERIETGANLPTLFFEGENDLIAFSDGGSIALIDLTTCDGTTCEIEYIDPPEDDFVFTTIAPDGTLAGLTTDGTVMVYLLRENGDYEESGGLVLGLDEVGNRDDITMAFSPDGTHLGIGIATDVIVWAWSNGDDVWFDQVGANVTSLAFSPDDQSTPPVLAVGQDDGGIELFDVSNPELRESVADPTVSIVTDIVFRPDLVDGSFRMASTHANGEVVLWVVFAEDDEAPFGAQTEAMLGHNDEALALGFSPDGRIASGDYNGETIWWNDVPVSSLGRSVGPPTDDLTGEESTSFEEVAFVDDDHVAARDLERSLWVHEISSDTSQRIDTPQPVQSMDASNGVIAAGLVDGATVLVDTAGTQLQLLEGGPSPVQYIALSDDTERVVTSFFDDETQVATAIGWELDTSTQQELALPDGFFPASLFVNDEVILVGGYSSESLPIAVAFDPTTGAEIGRMQHSDRVGNAVFAFAFTSDGSVLALASGDRRITLWNGETFERLSSDEFRGHRGNIRGVDFWDDDETLISVDDEGQVLMWDVDERRAFAQLGGPTDGLLSLDLDADAKLAVAGGEDGAVWGWSLDIDTWRQRACELAGRNMTAAEWGLYGDGTTRVRHCAQFPTGDGEVVEAVYADQQPD